MLCDGTLQGFFYWYMEGGDWKILLYSKKKFDKFIEDSVTNRNRSDSKF